MGLAKAKTLVANITLKVLATDFRNHYFKPMSKGASVHIAKICVSERGFVEDYCVHLCPNF